MFAFLHVFLGLSFLTCQSLGAAEPERSKINIFYSGGGFSISADLVVALEELLREEPQNLQLERIESGKIYFSGGTYLLETPSGLKREDLAGTLGPLKPGVEVEVVETARSIALAPPITYYPLAAKLLAMAQKPRFSGYSPDAVLRMAAKGTAATRAGDEIDYLSVAPASGAWATAAIFRYYLKAQGRPLTVTIIGKLLPSPAAQAALLQRRLAEIKNPALSLYRGGVYFKMPGSNGIGSHREYLDGQPYDFVIPEPDDFLFGWPELQRESASTLKPAWLISNLKFLKEGAVPFNHPWVIRDLGGIRVGLFALLQADINGMFESKGIPLLLEDPLERAGEIIKRLRLEEQVDLVVCISKLKKEDDARLLVQADHGIDILLADINHEVVLTRKVQTQFAGWSREGHRDLTLRPKSSQFALGDISLEFERKQSRWDLKEAEETSEPLAAIGSVDSAMLAKIDRSIESIVGPQESLLPDPRELWPSSSGYSAHFSYEPAEFFNISSLAIKERMKAEVGLMRIRSLRSSVPGPTPENVVRNWLYPDEKIAVIELSGRRLRQLLTRAAFEQIPVDDQKIPRGKYEAQAWLAVSGISRDGAVSGLPVQDNELYHVALPESLLKDKDLPGLANAQNIRVHEITVGEAVVGLLRSRRQERDGEARELYHQTLRRALGDGVDWGGPENAVKKKLDETFEKERRDAEMGADKKYYEDIRRMAESREEEKPLWRLYLRQASVQFANTQVANNQAYGAVPDARVQAVNQIFTRALAGFSSEFYWKKLTWDTGLTADYGRLTLRPDGQQEIDNETIDRLILETGLSHRTVNLERLLNARLGPFVNISYDTEFTRPKTETGVARRRFVRLKAGARIFQGRYLQSLSFGGLYQRNYAKVPQDSDLGWEARLSWASPVPKSAATLLLDASWREIESDSTDTAADLKSEMNARLALRVPVWEDLNVSPFVDFYRFKGQLGQPPGRNMIIGFSLEFAHLWKPLN